MRLQEQALNWCDVSDMRLVHRRALCPAHVRELEKKEKKEMRPTVGLLSPDIAALIGAKRQLLT
jgi:hypothetical protein